MKHERRGFIQVRSYFCIVYRSRRKGFSWLCIDIKARDLHS